MANWRAINQTQRMAYPDFPSLADTGANVLIADDVDINLAILCDLLFMLGLTPIKTQSGSRALEYAQKQRFDLMILDIRMPGCNGDELLRRLRQDESAASHDSPAIAVTGENDDEGFFDALRRIGFSKVIAKPWRNEDVLRTIYEQLRPRERFAVKGSLDTTPLQLFKLRRMFRKDLTVQLPLLEHNFLGPPMAYSQAVRDGVHRMSGAIGFVGAPKLLHALDLFRTHKTWASWLAFKAEAQAILDEVEAEPPN